MDKVLVVEVEKIKTDVVEGEDEVRVRMKVKVDVRWDEYWEEEVREWIKDELMEILPEDFTDEDEEVKTAISSINMEEFKKVFKKELNKLFKEFEYEAKELADSKYIIEIEQVYERVFEEDLDVDIEEAEKEMVEELEETFDEALYNTVCHFAEKLRKKILAYAYLKEVKEEEQEKPIQEKQEEEKPILEYKRAVIVSSKDFYITLPKSYLRLLYMRYEKVPKYVKFKVYSNGKVVIEPILSDKEISRDVLEWFNITKII